MALPVSFNRLDSLRGDHLQVPRMFTQSNGQCTVNVNCPSFITDGQDNGVINDNNLRKVPSIRNFVSKRVPVNMDWKNITLTTKEDVSILKGLSGSVLSGELTAIMGPSGAGKTSLLNVLSGFTRGKVSGQVLVNGLNREMKVFRTLNCYILQDDHLLPRLTVREIVTIAASLKIPSTVSKNERQKVIDDCLCSLGLMPHENKRANQLSGGQRKRLCVAQELISNPPLVFLDEPTSGLDSFSCMQCIELLKSLAKEGRTVVCTIHQPSSKIFEIFDKLYMLADGQCIYRGSTRELVPFLATQGLVCPQYYNPTDYVTEVALGIYGEWNLKLVNAINDIFKKSDQEIVPEVENGLQMNVRALNGLFRRNKGQSPVNQAAKLEAPHKGYATSLFNQFRVLFHRSFLCTFREPMNSHLKLLGNVLIGLLLGILYYNIGNDASKVLNNSGLFFCIIIFIIFASQLPTILIFPMERIIFEREHMNSWYCTGMYYLATTTAEIPFQILFTTINCSIVYWMSCQPADIVRFSFFLLSLVLLSLVSQAIGQLIGAGTDVQNGVYIACVASVPTLIFCGFFITLSTFPSYLQWLAYTSFARYALRSAMNSVYAMDREPLYCPRVDNTTHCIYEDPLKIIKDMDLEGELYIDYSVLFGFFVLFRIITYLVLKFRVMRTLQMKV